MYKYLLLSLILLSGCIANTDEKPLSQVQAPEGYHIVEKVVNPDTSETVGIAKDYESRLQVTDTKIHFTHPSYENIFMAKKSPVINDEGFIGAAGGGNWYTMALNSIKSIIGGILGWIWVIIILGIGCGILYFLVPAVQPIFNWLLRALASIIPFVGSLVENAVAKVKYVTPLTQVVDSGEAFKTLINNSTLLTPDIKTIVIDLWKQANVSKQDTSTETLIKNIKG